MKKHYPLFIALLFVGFFSAIAQDKEAERLVAESRKVLAEGDKLYRREMASWYGTDLFLAKFPDLRSKSGGYLSYVDNNKAICIFFSRNEPRKVIGTFTFDSTYNVNTAIVESAERDLTATESDLVAIREDALNQFEADRQLFKTYEKMNPNFIPLSDDLGKRVYVLTGPTENGVVVFGNDYLLTYDNNNKLVSKKQLHKNIIVIREPGDKKVLETMHSHLPETGDIITATDICTLRLYCPFSTWKQHTVMSDKALSLWSCEKNNLVTIPRDVVEKINADTDDIKTRKEKRKKKKK